MTKLMKIVIFMIMCALNADSKHLSQREKRFILQSDTATNPVTFPTPTTYPVPTLPNSMTATASQSSLQSMLPGSALINAINVQCPHKRSVGIQRVLLDDRLMKELYLELIGKFDHTRLAGNREDAEAHFRHILPTATNKTRFRHRHNGRKKSDLVSDLTKYTSWYNTVLKDIDTNFVTNKNHSNIGWRLEDILDKIEITKTQLKRILGLVHEIDEIKDLRLRMSNKRVKRTTTIGGLQTRTEYCKLRGTPAGNGYLHMCSACAMTTEFPEDMFPRYTNEITCDEKDCDCFQVHHTAHGKCQPIVKTVQMLRRNKGGCRMIIKNGQQIIVDDWELYEQPLHVGCECLFKKVSLFAAYIPKN